ncbi:ABC transporter permease [Mesorhizobium sp. B4-1-4]|uniref:ABC transporter permease n=1 Tax=Mesorhizobium sp. B4-1-4 TaxID=2589888 RepID=UPI00112B8596|nr:ABC transporter permease [Mesorhizobium sp. B4-1-4]UCI32095.1 ABC transporter permease [Mesorhizobium sp. B4-1-4]
MRNRSVNFSGSALVAALFLVALVLIATVGPELYSISNETMDLRARLAPPVLLGGTFAHPFGTDDLGRDVLIRLLYSIRVTIAVAFLATGFGATIGIVIGLLAAHFRGWVDDLLVVLIDLQAAVPYLLMVLALITVFGSNMTMFVLALGLHGWERYARLARGVALSLKNHGFALAVKGLGAGPLRIYGRHLLPNMAGVLITNFTLALPQVILLESSLSFLGVGIQAPETSLGGMVGFGRDYLTTAWWIAVIPALVIFAISIAVTAVGEEMREKLDPTVSQR